MTSHLRYDFPVVSLGEPEVPTPGGTSTEPIFDAEGKAWEKGEHGPEFGTVTVTYEEKPKPKKMEATFKFVNDDPVTYEGNIPGDGSGKGKERLKLKRQGKKKRKDPIELDSRNPKRWG